jgi:hypothetical protein
MELDCLISGLECRTWNSNLHERVLGLEVGHEGLALELVDQLVQVVQALTVSYVLALTVFWP